ncbi:MAG: chain-length determining protein [Syntrophaceae bacterium]|nr:chain-length determining protein [Syntrophaceae bacterium]
MPETAAKDIGDILAIVKRRKWSLVVPMILVFAGSAAVAFTLTPVYQSASTILIEEQDIPRDFVISTVTGFAEQRLQSINQRIMSTTKLLEIINRFNLYAEERKKQTTEEIVTRMREKDIKFQTISADIVDRRTGRATRATIAFSLSFRGERPALVQQVTNVLASLYLEENLKSREQQASSTSRFLEEEKKEVKAHLARIEARLTPFKTRHINELPEHLQVNLSALDRCERDIDRARNDLRTAQEREDYLRTQMEFLQSQPPAASNPGLVPKPPQPPNPDEILLRELKARLVQVKSKFTDKYPDVIKLKAEIAELEARVNSNNNEPEEETPSGETPKEEGPQHPYLITLASQLAGVRSEIESLKREIEEQHRKKEVYQRRVEATPAVEEEYKALLAERNSMQAKFDDLTRKLLEAKVSQGLEKEQMGERFTLIDPARFPERPVSPNIPAVLLIGLVLGIGVGSGTVALKEFADQSVRTADELAAVAQFPVLGGIPVILTKKERRRRRLKRWAALGSTLLVLTAVPLIFHFFIMDLDIFWAKLIRIYNRMM